MRREQYELLEQYMLSCMRDSAHDAEHVYRVLYLALAIAETEEQVDLDVLTAACLLHDIGRQEQFENPELCHAVVGAQKAERFLLEHGFGEAFAVRVSDCIRTHRYRKERPPESLEAKILFDADKIDVSGAVGIARTLLYQGQLAEPMYSVRSDGEPSDGSEDTLPSFFQEYRRKLERIYGRFFTRRGAQIAQERREAAVSFYESLLAEVREDYRYRKLGSLCLGDFPVEPAEEGEQHWDGEKQGTDI